MSRFKLLEHYDKICKHHILLDFQGAMTHDMLVVMSELIRCKLACQYGRNEIVKRIFSVFIELTQNIAQYSEERVLLDDNGPRVGAGLIVLTETADFFTITSGNLIRNRVIPDIVERLERINHLDEEGLKGLYKETIRAPRREGHAGAGLGLISIARKTGMPIHYNIVPSGDHTSFLVLSAAIRQKSDAALHAPCSSTAAVSR